MTCRYLVVDLMSGGDLRFHISRKTFTEDAVRFWIAELGCALRYIHGQGIIHRDVKPDNVLLDADGHVHLTDFVCWGVRGIHEQELMMRQNVASDIIPGKILTSKSGTLAYLAPEVYAGKGYDWRADWWSLGVLFYECIYNKVSRHSVVTPLGLTHWQIMSRCVMLCASRHLPCRKRGRETGHND